MYLRSLKNSQTVKRSITTEIISVSIIVIFICESILNLVEISEKAESILPSLFEFKDITPELGKGKLSIPKSLSKMITSIPIIIRFENMAYRIV